MKKGILLINLGTPDTPEVSDVRKYLREFLMDRRVIDLPYLSRWLLVNLIIAPFRAPKSAKAYQKLWTKEGSPLLYHSENIKKRWQHQLGENYMVELAMRYQKPDMEKAVKNLLKANVSSITVVPLYPQYASSTTGSSIEKFMEIIKKEEVIPEIKIVPYFYDNKSFIKILTGKGKKMLEQKKYDYILFSYHGVPERHIKKGDKSGKCDFNEKCCGFISKDNEFCYKAQCVQTTRLLMNELQTDIPYQTVFQSRLETRAKEPWLKPYADEVIKDLAHKGVKNILVFSPAFVADCLETIIEIGEEYAEMFQELGGESLDLVEAVNEQLPADILNQSLAEASISKA